MALRTRKERQESRNGIIEYEESQVKDTSKLISDMKKGIDNIISEKIDYLNKLNNKSTPEYHKESIRVNKDINELNYFYQKVLELHQYGKSHKLDEYAVIREIVSDIRDVSYYQNPEHYADSPLTAKEHKKIANDLYKLDRIISKENHLEAELKELIPKAIEALNSCGTMGSFTHKENGIVVHVRYEDALEEISRKAAYAVNTPYLKEVLPDFSESKEITKNIEIIEKYQKYVMESKIEPVKAKRNKVLFYTSNYKSNDVVLLNMLKKANEYYKINQAMKMLIQKIQEMGLTKQYTKTLAQATDISEYLTRQAQIIIKEFENSSFIEMADLVEAQEKKEKHERDLETLKQMYKNALSKSGKEQEELIAQLETYQTEIGATDMEITQIQNYVKDLVHRDKLEKQQIESDKVHQKFQEETKAIEVAALREKIEAEIISELAKYWRTDEEIDSITYRRPLDEEKRIQQFEEEVRKRTDMELERQMRKEEEKITSELKPFEMDSLLDEPELSEEAKIKFDEVRDRYTEAMNLSITEKMKKYILEVLGKKEETSEEVVEISATRK